MSSAPESTPYMPMAAPPPRPPMRTTAGPSPRLGPAQTPQDDMQFSMDLEDGSASASGATQPVAPRTSQSDGASQKKHTHDGSSAPSRSRSTGGSRRDSRRGSFDAQAERMEKRPRLSATGGTPMSISPMLGPSSHPFVASGMLVPLDADVQPASAVRNHEFQTGRRVFHVHFGHGYVAALERQVAQGSAETPELERVLSAKTHNIEVVFDNPKYKELRLRAFYAVPKMVVIPSASALRKRKKHLMQRFDGPGSSVAERVAQVKEMLSSGGLRLACEMVGRWSLQHAFEPAQLLKRLVDAKEYAAAVRFAREFNLRKEYPLNTLLHAMLAEKRYDGALRACANSSRYVDGELQPADVLELMVRAGEHCVALKYVHKFGAAKAFPPAQLVQASLQSKELSVRTAAMLLKYISLFRLEEAFPREAVLERVAASGIVVRETPEGKLFIKGRRRNESTLQPPVAPQLKVGSAPV